MNEKDQQSRSLQKKTQFILCRGVHPLLVPAGGSFQLHVVENSSKLISKGAYQLT